VPRLTHLVLAVVLAAPLSVAAQSTPHYEITKAVALGAPDRWDYVVFDAATERVYVAHGDGVSVVDARSGAVVGTVPGFAGGTHGIAIVPGAKRGYTDDGRAGEAGSFNLQSLQVEKRIRAAVGADAMLYDPFSKHVFVVSGDAGTLTVVDPRSDEAVGTVTIGGDLESLVADERGKIYVNGAERKEIVRVDTRTNQADARWSVPECTSPHGLAMDRATQRLFVSCVNNLLVVVDAQSGATVAQLPIGSGTDAAAFDPKRKLIFSSNGRDGTLSVVQEKDANTFVGLGNIETRVSARTMDLDPRSGRIFLAAAEVDQNAPPPVPGQRRGPPIVPGSLQLLFLDPAR
jgi:DNA-binding beta-propeller fold protein YncE